MATRPLTSFSGVSRSRRTLIVQLAAWPIAKLSVSGSSRTFMAWLAAWPIVIVIVVIWNVKYEFYSKWRGLSNQDTHSCVITIESVTRDLNIWSWISCESVLATWPFWTWIWHSITISELLYIYILYFYLLCLVTNTMEKWFY